MSENVVIGEIGQLYGNRKNGNVGVLKSRDDEKKLLTMQADGDAFTVSYSAFRSNWRKVADISPSKSAKTEPVVAESAPTAAETAEDNSVPTTDASEPATVENAVDTSESETVSAPADEPACDAITPEDCKVGDFFTAVQSARNIEMEKQNETTKIIIDGVAVMSILQMNGVNQVRMLPDVYTYSTWGDAIRKESTHFNLGAPDRMSVSLIANCSYGDILQIVKDAIISINLYGYISEE